MFTWKSSFASLRNLKIRVILYQLLKEFSIIWKNPAFGAQADVPLHFSLIN